MQLIVSTQKLELFIAIKAVRTKKIASQAIEIPMKVDAQLVVYQLLIAINLLKTLTYSVLCSSDRCSLVSTYAFDASLRMSQMYRSSSSSVVVAAIMAEKDKKLRMMILPSTVLNPC